VCFWWQLSIRDLTKGRTTGSRCGLVLPIYCLRLRCGGRVLEKNLARRTTNRLDWSIHGSKDAERAFDSCAMQYLGWNLSAATAAIGTKRSVSASNFGWPPYG